MPRPLVAGIFKSRQFKIQVVIYQAIKLNPLYVFYHRNIALRRISIWVAGADGGKDFERSPLTAVLP
jgi:hypothetical protein